MQGTNRYGHAGCVLASYYTYTLPPPFAGNELFEFNATSGDSLQPDEGPFLRGHAPKELWGLSCNPSAPEFCTIGDDKQLRIWDIYSKR